VQPKKIEKGKQERKLGKKRKRSVLEKSVTKSKKRKLMKNSRKVAILSTRVTAKVKKAVGNIGAKLILSPTSKVTHLCIDKFSLTETILCGLAYCDHLVSEKWLLSSGQRGSEENFGIKADSALLKVEKQLGFKLSEVILRRNRKKNRIFHNLKLYLTTKVKASLRHMFTAHGGKLARRIGKKRTSNVIVLGQGKSDKEAKKLTENKFKVHTPFWVYAAILRQKLPGASEFRMK